MDQETMVRAMKTIRRQYSGITLPRWDPNVPNIYFEETSYQGKSYQLPLVILKTKACRWVNVNGGCTTCNYQLVASLRDEQHVTQNQILTQVQWAIDQLEPRGKYPFMHVTSSGSFMDPLEIEESTRIAIARMLREVGVRTLAFESRPEFLVDSKKLSIMRQELGGELSVGVGLESSSDFVRTICVNKGYPIDTFVKAARALRSSGATFYTYVMLGKPFLSPKEDVDDAVQTILFSFSHGARICLLMVANLQPYTLTHWLWERNLYALPSLWAPLEVLKLLPEDQRNRIIVKGFDKAVPTSEAFATSCPKCATRVVSAINAWDMTGNYDELEAVHGTCECEDLWVRGYARDWQSRRQEAFSRVAAELTIHRQ